MKCIIGKWLIVLWIFFFSQTIGKADNINNNEIEKCNLSINVKNEIKAYKPMVHNIISEALSGTFKGRTWQELADFVDNFGPRFTGTQVLEDSIDYVLNKSRSYKLENVHGEIVKVPHWVRGFESATLIQPRRKNIAILGLGYSVGTPKEGITASAIVVDSFAELESRANEVPGKIVVFNEKYVSYDKTVKYRSSGASKAAEFGAVAVLIRSVTPVSLYTPHTGMMDYTENITKIPAACITAEDSTLLRRIANKHKNIIIRLKMDAHSLPDKESRNVVAEISGRDKPEGVVVVSGHIDSWDVGEGAMDDGGGAFISWNALQLLKQLNYRPRRTIRMIMWTAEEMGLIGAGQYVKQHKAEEKNLQFVMESDIGTFTPLGIEYTGVPYVGCVLQEILKLMSPLGEMKVRTPNAGPDISYWIEAGVPGGSLWNKNDKYFYYHHSNADTMLVENPETLDMGTALFAAVSYVLADISIDLPRHKSLDIISK
ncbi:PREDICTED: carboxypeptidase Q-like [Polistes dominula]|uniref:Carboxypeptidase Q n=1 Tax=Polistes dominula TaxID=743375 RepID=A0ABM1IEJ7_POLDO|nr:PREDICTED: carboxypeptidase Q-like [Polistes dominula]XP_015178634.1 PREDICTED: carboxypeptidase Q-like [Polistes dominula]XP_015178635.1 PREDICTED: carboxypeptidase Q-like [Polistes dominula]